MAYSYNKFIGDGVTTNFNITFSFIDRDYVKVYVDEVDTAFTWVSDSIVQVSPAPAVSAVVNVKRDTPKDVLLVDFNDGSILDEAALDLANQQAQHIAQEAFDVSETSINQDLTNQFDALGKQIKNVADPTDPQDAATKNWAETTGGSFVTDSAANAAAAAASASAASTSETNAAASASAASTSETNAGTSETNAAASASAASTSETNAGTSETNAAASASAASTSETNAAASEATASSAATAAAASYDSFDDRYLGEKASDPTLDNDGAALLTGALYWNNVTDTMMVYNGAGWQQAYNASTGISDSAASVAVTITAGLNVGIGEGTPLGRLHVKTGDNGLGTLLADADEFVIEGSSHSGMHILSGTGAYGTIAFGDNTAANPGFMRYRHDSNSWQLGTNAAVAITVDSSQKVGIGVTTPATNLHIKDASSTTKLYLTSIGTGDTAGDGFGLECTTAGAAYLWNRENTSMFIGTNGTTAITINNTQNVGIGETTPLGKLHVKSADSGGTPSANGDELVVEGSGDTGISIMGGAANGLSLRMGDSANTSAGMIYYNTAADSFHLYANGAAFMNAISTGSVGFGETTPLGKVHIKSTDTAASVNSGADLLVLESSASNGLTLLSGTTSNGNIYFGTSVGNALGRIVYAHASGDMVFYTANVQRGYFGGSGGLIIGSPTGGDLGTGTINAKAVYDDNVLLTCYVFDQAVEGDIAEPKWDDKVPNTMTLGSEAVPAVMDEEGNVIKPEIPEVLPQEEVRIHEPMRKFKSRIGTDYDPLDIDKYAQHWKDKKHLTSMPNEVNYDPVKDKLDMGNWVQRLIETVEIQAVHIETLNQRVKNLEASINP